MEFRAEKRTIAWLTGLLLAPALFGQQSFQYEAWHGHSRVYSLPPHVKKAGARGTLTIDETGVSFEQAGESGKGSKHPERFRWEYPDIEQLKISTRSLSVVTYKDNKWKLGADRQYDFDILSEATLEDAYRVLRASLDQRFVAALADTPAAVLWEIPVKHLGTISGDEGVLQVGPSEIVYESDKKGGSRTWRYEDIDNISNPGPFEFTITTFERAKFDYGSRKQFNFSLKRPLEEGRYNDLWLRLNQSKGLKVLTTYRQGETLR